MSLLYLPEDLINPFDLPRVYFCACPEDYFYLNQISKDIFRFEKCTVWYKSDPKEMADEADLLKMNIIVLPITRTMLITENNVIEEYNVAKKLKKPILPIMIDSNATELFNKKFLHMQYIDRNSNDATAISYEKKLQRFLKANLLNDETIEKIKRSFAAYIFLSYRKKDRKYVNEIMKLIHQDRFALDVAIWYDEYLNPGEDFNNDIQRMLKKSSMMSLLITPNLVDEDNYVIKHEYPDFTNSKGMKNQKPVLPIMMEETDYNKAIRVFPGLGEIFDRCNYPASVRNACESIGYKCSAMDAENAYLIGLAYLSGIDVENDGNIAIDLITESASAGYVPAMEKLSEVYKYGIGVDPDLPKAIHYQKKYVSELKKIITPLSKPKDVFALADAYGELCRMLVEFNSHIEASAYAKELLAFAKKFKFVDSSDDSKSKANKLRLIYKAYYTLALDACPTLNYPDRIYKKMVAALEELTKYDDSDDVLDDLEDAYSYRQIINILQGDLREECNSINNQILINQRRFSKTKNIVFLKREGSSHSDLACCYFKINEFEKARKSFKDCYDCCFKAFEADGDCKVLLKVLESVYELIYLASEKSNEEKEFYVFAADGIRKKLKDSKDSYIFGKLYLYDAKYENDPEKKEKKLLQAIKCFKTEADKNDFDNVSEMEECIISLFDIPWSIIDDNYHNRRLKYAKMMIELHLAEKKSVYSDKTEVNGKLADDYDRIAGVYINMEKYDKALSYCEESVVMRDKLDRSSVSQKTAESYGCMAYCLEKTGKTEKAFEVFDKSLNMFQIVQKEYRTDFDISGYSEVLREAFNASLNTEDNDQRMKYAKKLLDFDLENPENCDKIMGLNSFLTAYQFYFEKIGEESTISDYEKAKSYANNLINNYNKKLDNKSLMRFYIIFLGIAKIAGVSCLLNFKPIKAFNFILLYKKSEYGLFKKAGFLTWKVFNDIIRFIIPLIAVLYLVFAKKIVFWIGLPLCIAYAVLCFVLYKYEKKSREKIYDKIEKMLDL